MRGTHLRRFLSVLAVAGSIVVVPASARSQVPGAAPNLWLDRRVLNIAHQGGEMEAPSNTMYALKTAVEKGADVLEIDVHATADREIVVIHDAEVDRTTNGSGSLDEMTLEQVQALDAAHWFVPGCGTCHGRAVEEYTLRGYATGERELPEELERFRPSDFRIPTLREVLETFPEMLINIEIKTTAPDTEPYEAELAALLREFNRTSDTIVVSFLDHAVEAFDVHAPEVDTATGTGQAGLFWASSQQQLPGSPSKHQALQVPIVFNGVTVVTEDLVRDAHANGIAVHVWTINSRDEMEFLIDIGVDGIMTDRPTLLEQVLAESAGASGGGQTT